ncbi:inosine monophosphate dehydrogenase [Choiromyces venosus 120613-1]|uniref:Inosine monophosphate dehydrogenase n=1 Tax=Choiromyces venosus 120613-1 TaxID=1336337 RepID=A0A3N4JJG1_9PEZI|nr:inosine monophosphate dehydrogenase [Choiromyces venosus 120613-1]
MSSQPTPLTQTFPWTKTPLIVSAPMRTVSGIALAVAVSKAGGIGFYGPGYDVSSVPAALQAAREAFALSDPAETLPIGVGFLLWKCPLEPVLEALKTYRPAAVWLFAPKDDTQMEGWVRAIRSSAPDVSIWVQVGSCVEAAVVVRLDINVLVLQGGDAGGHGIAGPRGSLLQLLPEVLDLLGGRSGKAPVVLAAGGIVDGRGVSAALMLGAHGAVMGTRFIASEESEVHDGFRENVVRASDGGSGTVRTRLYDELRGTGDWPEQYDGRAIVNETFQDHLNGLPKSVNKELYDTAAEAGQWNRLTMFAGTGVGLVNEVLPAGMIVEEVRSEAVAIIARLGRVYAS